jgi:hypothetical protein
MSAPTHPRVLLLLATACLLPGCASRSPEEEVSWQASRHGTAAADHGRAGLDTASGIVERYYYVAKYQATQEQRQIAAAAGRRANSALRQRSASGKSPRFIAVRTRSDTRARTSTSVMIWDTQAQDVVGNNVYDLNGTPPLGTRMKFDTYAAEYVGIGAP